MHFLFYLLKQIQRHYSGLLQAYVRDVVRTMIRANSSRIMSNSIESIEVGSLMKDYYCLLLFAEVMMYISIQYCILHACYMLHNEPFLTIVTFKTVGYCLDCVQVTLNSKLQLLNTLLLLSWLLSTSIFDANYASCWWKLWLWWHARYFKLACITLFALLHRVCGIKGPATFGK